MCWPTKKAMFQTVFSVLTKPMAPNQDKLPRRINLPSVDTISRMDANDIPVLWITVTTKTWPESLVNHYYSYNEIKAKLKFRDTFPISVSQCSNPLYTLVRRWTPSKDQCCFKMWPAEPVITSRNIYSIKGSHIIYIYIYIYIYIMILCPYGPWYCAYPTHPIHRLLLKVKGITRLKWRVCKTS